MDGDVPKTDILTCFKCFDLIDTINIFIKGIFGCRHHAEMSCSNTGLCSFFSEDAAALTAANTTRKHPRSKIVTLWSRQSYASTEVCSWQCLVWQWRNNLFDTRLVHLGSNPGSSPARLLLHLFSPDENHFWSVESSKKKKKKSDIFCFESFPWQAPGIGNFREWMCENCVSPFWTPEDICLSQRKFFIFRGWRRKAMLYSECNNYEPKTAKGLSYTHITNWPKNLILVEFMCLVSCRKVTTRNAEHDLAAAVPRLGEIACWVGDLSHMPGSPRCVVVIFVSRGWWNKTQSSM